MKEEEFPQNVKARALVRCGHKCERCWSSRALELHHKIPLAQGGELTLDNCVVLCERCRLEAPSDPTVLEEFFLPFASPKELILRYGVSNEKEAIERRCNRIGLDASFVEDILGLSNRSGLRKESMRTKIGEVAHASRYPPYGYEIENGELKIDHKEASVVRDMNEKYLNGQTMKSIAEDLNARGIGTRKGKKWTVWSIRHILRDPTYAGYVRSGQQLSKGKHKPIVSTQTFNLVQKRIVDRIRNPRFKYRPTLLPEST